MYLTHLSHKKATYFSGFVTLFCYWVRFVIFKQMQHVTPNWKGAYLVKYLWTLKPKSKVSPTPCKFEMFCSVNNLSNLYIWILFRIWSYEFAVKPKCNCHFINKGRVSNDDGEGNENVPSYQNRKCELFFFNFSAFISVNSLKMANKSEFSYGVLGTAPKFGLREEIEFVPVLTSSKHRCKRNFTVVFVQVVKKSALDVQNFKCCFSFTYWAHYRRCHRRLRPFLLLKCTHTWCTSPLSV